MKKEGALKTRGEKMRKGEKKKGEIVILLFLQQN